MAQIIVKHRVKDYERWRSFFDAAGIIRKLYGEKEQKIFRNADDPNDISILIDWEGPEKVIDYAMSDELKKAMKMAGVIGEPAVFILEEDLMA